MKCKWAIIIQYLYLFNENNYSKKSFLSEILNMHTYIITYIYFTNNRHYVFFHERDCKRNFK